MRGLQHTCLAEPRAGSRSRGQANDKEIGKGESHGCGFFSPVEVWRRKIKEESTEVQVRGRSRRMFVRS